MAEKSTSNGLELVFQAHSKLWETIMVVCFNMRKDQINKTHFPALLIPPIERFSIKVDFIIGLTKDKRRHLIVSMTAGADNMTDCELKFEQRITNIELKQCNSSPETLVETCLQQMYITIGARIEQAKGIIMGG